MQTKNQCKPSATAHPYVLNKLYVTKQTSQPQVKRFHFLADDRGWSRQWISRARVESDSCSYFSSCKPFPLYLQQTRRHRGGIASVVRTITQLDTAAVTPTLALPDNTLWKYNRKLVDFESICFTRLHKQIILQIKYLWFERIIVQLTPVIEQCMRQAWCGWPNHIIQINSLRHTTNEIITTDSSDPPL